MSLVPCKYLNTRFACSQCTSHGFAMWLLSQLTAMAMSGRVHTAAYNRLPTKLLYGTSDPSGWLP